MNKFLDVLAHIILGSVVVFFIGLLLLALSVIPELLAAVLTVAVLFVVYVVVVWAFYRVSTIREWFIPWL